MTVTRAVADAVKAAERALPATMPLLTVSGEVAKTTNQPPGIVQAILQDRCTIQERAA